MPQRENISYLVPRDPSIQCWDDRVKLSGPRTKNLIQMGLDELEETMGGKIKVYLRLKPSYSTGDNAYTVLDSNTLQTEAPKDSVSYKNVTNGIGKLIHKFTFTSVLDSEVTQSDLFKKCAVKSISRFINGENYLLMAYGTTSAGKTYTMQGNVDHPGVIPRALDFVFNNLKNNIVLPCQYQPHQYNELVTISEEQMRRDQTHKNFILNLDLSKCQRYPDASHTTLQTNSSSGFSEIYENATFKLMQTRLTDSLELESQNIDLTSSKYSVWISMIEIYNEQVYDLLELPNEKGVRTKLAFRDDENGNTFVKNLRYVSVSSGHEAFQILQFGRTNLHFAPTALNQSSSRSHCIFTITLAKFLDSESSSCAIMSRFSFCDLAGMERAKKTLNSKDRLVESKAINTSLSILVKCLTMIKENQNNKEKKLIPYRESKLTKLFREAVTGKEQFSLIVNVTTEANLFDETLNVLKFSAIAQKIVPQNVFIKPKMTKPLKKSRFSQLVTNCSYNSKTIDWDATTVDGSRVKDEYSSEVADLQDLIEKLQEELSKQKKRCSEIESEIREELTTKFSEMLKKQRDNNEARLESERERLEEMYERKERRLIKYYEILNKNKRQRLEDEESREYEDQEQRMEEIQRENEMLNSKVQVLTERLQKLGDEHKNKLAECSALKFTVAEKNRRFEELKRVIDAKTAGEDSLEAELKRQLDDAKNKIADYKILLDEAASDYKELEESNKYLRNENEILEQCLAEQRDAVEDHLNEISELQKMMTTKRIAIEKLEDVNEKLSQELKALTMEKENDEHSMADIYKKELESLREQFKMTSVKLSECRTELEASQLEKNQLESELKQNKSALMDLEKKMSDSSNEFALEKKTLVEKFTMELSEAKTKAEDLKREKEILQHKFDELDSEIKSLQRDSRSEIEMEKIELEAELKLTKNKLEELEKKVSDSVEKSTVEKNDLIEKLTIELYEAKSKMEGFEREKEFLQQKCDELNSEIKLLQKEIKDLLAEANNGKQSELEKELSYVKEKLNEQFEKMKVKERETKQIVDDLQSKIDAAELQARVIPQLQEEIIFLKSELCLKEQDLRGLENMREGLTGNHEEKVTETNESEELQADFSVMGNEINSTTEPVDPSLREEKSHKALQLSENESKVKDQQEEEVANNEDVDNGDRQRQETISGQSDSSPEKVKRKCKNVSPQKLAKQLENLSLQPRSTRKKVDLLDESVHPSAIKRTNRGKKKNEKMKKEKEAEKENEKEPGSSVKKKGKCYKKLFTENDFDGLTDLNASPIEYDIPRLRPRK